MWAIAGWSGDPADGLEVLSWGVPKATPETLAEFATKLIPGRYKKIFVLKHAFEVSHPDYPPIDMDPPVDEDTVQAYLAFLGQLFGS